MEEELVSDELIFQTNRAHILTHTIFGHTFIQNAFLCLAIETFSRSYLVLSRKKIKVCILKSDSYAGYKKTENICFLKYLFSFTQDQQYDDKNDADTPHTHTLTSISSCINYALRAAKKKNFSKLI